MLRVIAALFCLGIGVIAWVLLTPAVPGKAGLAAAPTQPTPDAVHSPAVAVAPDTGHGIRVVYPGPDGSAQVRKLSDKVADSAPVTPVAAPAVQAASPAPSSVPSAEAVVATPASVAGPKETVVAAASATTPVTPAPVNPQALDINTASIEALNQIPGAGRIGRTIASHRPYHSVEDLLNKRVVRKSVYDVIKSQVAAN